MKKITVRMTASVRYTDTINEDGDYIFDVPDPLLCASTTETIDATDAALKNAVVAFSERVNAVGPVIVAMA